MLTLSRIPTKLRFRNNDHKNQKKDIAELGKVACIQSTFHSISLNSSPYCSPCPTRLLSMQVTWSPGWSKETPPPLFSDRIFLMINGLIYLLLQEKAEVFWTFQVKQKISRSGGEKNYTFINSVNKTDNDNFFFPLSKHYSLRNTREFTGNRQRK